MDLNTFSQHVTSQHGEDGILEAIFTRLGVVRGSCVEFGAWDGELHSNTYNLIVNRAWSAVLIEANPERFQALKHTSRDWSNVTAVNRIVGFDSPDTLDEILKSTWMPLDFDLLSIDIDGNDYHVFEALRVFTPRVVVIEFNPTIPNEWTYIQPRDMKVNKGSSLRAIVDLARRKGYEFVATTICNAIFVRADLFPKMEIQDNSVEALHKDTSHQTHIVQHYDGTVGLIGVNCLLWHTPSLKIELPQVLPQHLRVFPDALVDAPSSKK
jgi:hypothetical protein